MYEARVPIFLYDPSFSTQACAGNHTLLIFAAPTDLEFLRNICLADSYFLSQYRSFLPHALYCYRQKRFFLLI